MLPSKRKLIILTAAVLAVSLLSFGIARADTVGERHDFFANPSFDLNGRSSLPATLELTANHAYYYVDDQYLDSLSSAGRTAMMQQLVGLANEFDNNIYPKETAFWGSEANPGIDGDSHITVLLEKLKSGTGGYFDSSNGYPTSVAPSSNQREMLILNADSLNGGHLDVFLAHEMQHLISFNQKDLLHHVSEDTWLNELRSQYAVTVAGYNDNFSGSDLEERAVTFLQNPTDSVTEWPNTEQDYAPVTLLGEYMVEHYGSGILTDTLHSSLTGIDSIDAWLSHHGYSQRFQDIFADWELASYLNDTTANPLYGYTRSELTQLAVSPVSALNIGPSGDNYQFSVKPWQPEWYYFTVAGQPASSSLQIGWDSTTVSMLYYDNLGRVQEIANPSEINSVSGLEWFVLMPVNASQRSDFGASEAATTVNLNFQFIAGSAASRSSSLDISPVIHDGSLIKHASAPDIYVVTGAYKRLLEPSVLAMYGLDASQAVTVPETVFESYKTSNYVRAIDDKKVYAVWPDGTKHWLNISAVTFTNSGRDWNSIFIINDFERDFYKTGPNITH